MLGDHQRGKWWEWSLTLIRFQNMNYIHILWHYVTKFHI
jgi:hypothetical protein